MHKLNNILFVALSKKFRCFLKKGVDYDDPEDNEYQVEDCGGNKRHRDQDNDVLFHRN
jgi:hypothetical protein